MSESTASVAPSRPRIRPPYSPSEIVCEIIAMLCLAAAFACVVVTHASRWSGSLMGLCVGGYISFGVGQLLVPRFPSVVKPTPEEAPLVYGKARRVMIWCKAASMVFFWLMIIIIRFIHS